MYMYGDLLIDYYETDQVTVQCYVEGEFDLLTEPTGETRFGIAVQLGDGLYFMDELYNERGCFLGARTGVWEFVGNITRYSTDRGATWTAFDATVLEGVCLEEWLNKPTRCEWYCGAKFCKECTNGRKPDCPIYVVKMYDKKHNK